MCVYANDCYPLGSQMVLMVKNIPANARDARDVGSVPKLERSPEEGNGNPLQDSSLENSNLMPNSSILWN